MNEFKPILRLVITVQIFLLFSVIILPVINPPLAGTSREMGVWIFCPFVHRPSPSFAPHARPTRIIKQAVKSSEMVYFRHVGR